MRVAAICDIHGNLPALEAVLDEIRRERADLIVVVGDVVPGPLPKETMARLAAVDIPIRYVHGNGDREVVEYMLGRESSVIPEQYRESMRWNARELKEYEATLAGWPLTERLSIDGVGDVLFCHATPRNDTEIFSERTPEAVLRPIFDAAGASLVVCGHTHIQFDRTIGKTRVANAGSVGMPFQEAGAYWLRLGPGVELRRTSYDLEKAAARIRQSADPQAGDFAAKYVLNPPSAESMLAYYAPHEIKA